MSESDGERVPPEAFEKEMARFAVLANKDIDSVVDSSTEIESIDRVVGSTPEPEPPEPSRRPGRRRVGGLLSHLADVVADICERIDPWLEYADEPAPPYRPGRAATSAVLGAARDALQTFASIADPRTSIDVYGIDRGDAWS